MQSLRSYLQRLEETIHDQLVKVKEEVDWRYEVTAYVAEAEKTGENPAFLFENVKGYATPLLHPY